MWRVVRAYALVWHRCRWVGRHHLPSEGGVLITSNHPTGIDPFLIQAGVPRVVRWVMFEGYRFPAAEALWRVVDPITVGHDRPHVAQLRQMLHRLADGEVVGIFPEGAAQRGERMLKPFQPGIGLLGKRSNAWIVPVWIKGTPQKRNMFWHFALPSRATVIFGEPYRADPTLSHEQVADDLRRRIIALRGQTAD